MGHKQHYLKQEKYLEEKKICLATTLIALKNFSI
jgi:hypothetical protein